MSTFLNYDGRINRLKYFFYVFMISLISGISGFILEDLNNIPGCMIIMLINIFFVIKYICIMIQRLHDLGRPGTHFWLLLIPVYNIYLALLMLFKKGSDGQNMFGEDPLPTA